MFLNLRARALGVCMSLTLCLVTEKLEKREIYKSLVVVCLRIINNLRTGLFFVKHSVNYYVKIFVASNHMLGSEFFFFFFYTMFIWFSSVKNG